MAISTFSQYHPHFFCCGGLLSVPRFERRGDQKNECLEGIKGFLPKIFSEVAYYICCQERLCKTKHGFEGLVSNVDLDSPPGSTHLFYT